MESKKDVLLMTADVTLRESFQELDGFMLQHVSCCEEALRVFQERASYVDLFVVIDTRITAKESHLDPNKDCLGFKELLRALCQHRIEPTYVVLSPKLSLEEAVFSYQWAVSYYGLSTLAKEQVSALLLRLKQKGLNAKKAEYAFYADNVFSRESLLDMLGLVALRSPQEREARLLAHTRNPKQKRLLDFFCQNHLSVESIKRAFERCLCCESLALKKPKFLIVEDDPASLAIASAQLRDYFHVFQAQSQEEAMRLLEGNGDIKYVLMDVYVEDGEGEQLFSALKEKVPQAHILVFTAFEELHMVQKLLLAGACDYITKPYEEKELVQRCAMLYLKENWPFFQYKLDIHSLSYQQRLFLLDYVLLAKQEQDSHYMDFICLYPEVLDTIYACV